MAVAIEMHFRGATLDQYDQIIQKMGLTPGGATPPDAISHWVAETDDGLHIVDVWETREAYDRFAQEQIGPVQRRGRHHRAARDALLRGPQPPWARPLSCTSPEPRRPRGVVGAPCPLGSVSDEKRLYGGRRFKSCPRYWKSPGNGAFSFPRRLSARRTLAQLLPLPTRSPPVDGLCELLQAGVRLRRQVRCRATIRGSGGPPQDPCRSTASVL